MLQIYMSASKKPTQKEKSAPATEFALLMIFAAVHQSRASARETAEGLSLQAQLIMRLPYSDSMARSRMLKNSSTAATTMTMMKIGRVMFFASLRTIIAARTMRIMLTTLADGEELIQLSMPSIFSTPLFIISKVFTL